MSASSEPLRITNVVVPVADGVAAFELGVACELFGLDRTDQGLPRYRFALASVSGGPVRTTAGFDIAGIGGLGKLTRADLICLVAGDWAEEPLPSELRKRIVAAHGRGAHIMAICRGAFLLAQTGLLDGRRATTHWRWLDEFERRFPSVDVERDALYVDDGTVSTSAGTAAGLDLGLHLIRRAHGASVAVEVARRMVLAPHRDGGQAQFVSNPVRLEPAPDPILDTLSWALEHLEECLDVPTLARRAGLSTRAFTRALTDTQGVSPARWITAQRVRRAQELLEQTDESIARVATLSGFGSDTVLRANFTRTVGCTPTSYRATFGPRALA